MSMKDVKLELDEIELQQQGLERQGVRLEQLIRDKCETGARVDGKFVIKNYNVSFFLLLEFYVN